MNDYYLDKLRKLMKEQSIDAVLVCPSEELNFLMGFTPGMCERFQAMFFKQDGGMFYFSNLLYAGEVNNGFKGKVKIYSWFDGDVMVDKIAEAFKAEGISGTIGVNSTAQAFNIIAIAEKTGLKFVNAKPLLEEMRIVKNEEELECLRVAAQIADKAYEEVVKFIKPGIKEADIADFLISSMTKHGGGPGFCIVASGENSSYPHYHGKERVITEQDVIILDFGCTYKGLCSDTSRTVFVGGVTDEQRKVYELVRKSNEAGEAAATLGAFIPDIDKASRDIIDAAGYGDTFVNRLGHGIGFMVHEAPDIKSSNPRKLEKGMCFSVEPGIYIAGRFGMRVEDIVIISDKGTEILNKTTHDLVILNNK